MVLHALLVEDDWLVAAELEAVFGERGFFVTRFSTAEEALVWLAETNRVDVVITDIRLKGLLSGWDLAERARVAHPDVSIIYATGTSPVSARQVPRSLYLSKPYSSAALVTAALKLVSASRDNGSFSG